MAGQWYMAIGGHQVGPVSEDEIRTNLANGSIDANTLMFTAGMANWTPLSAVPQFASALNPRAGGAAAAEQRGRAPRARHRLQDHRRGHAVRRSGARSRRERRGRSGRADVHDAGHPDGNRVRRRQPAGKPGDHGRAPRRGQAAADRREPVHDRVHERRGPGKQRVAFAAPYAGRIIPLDLASLGGQLVCQKDSFLCAARGVSIGIAFQRKIGVGLFGGEGFIMQRLEGDGLCFVHAGGMVHPLELAPGETLRVDTGLPRRAPADGAVRHPVRRPHQDRALRRRGNLLRDADRPGKVWLQSLPLSRLADRIYKAAPKTGRRTEEGSVLDKAFGFGNVIDGD